MNQRRDDMKQYMNQKQDDSKQKFKNVKEELQQDMSMLAMRFGEVNQCMRIMEQEVIMLKTDLDTKRTERRANAGLRQTLLKSCCNWKTLMKRKKINEFYYPPAVWKKL